MEHFTHPSTVPPGGMYFYTVPVTGGKFSHPSMEGLLKMVRAHMKANAIEIPGNLAEIVEDFICRNVPLGFCVGEPTGPRVRFLSFPEIREGTRLLVQRAHLGDDQFYVSSEEANRRAKICSNCPRNNKGICVSCNTGDLKTFASKLISSRNTKFDDYMGVCEACGCLLKAKVHVSVEGLAVTQKQEYPDNCWLHGTVCDAGTAGSKP